MYENRIRFNSKIFLVYHEGFSFFFPFCFLEEEFSGARIYCRFSLIYVNGKSKGKKLSLFSSAPHPESGPFSYFLLLFLFFLAAHCYEVDTLFLPGSSPGGSRVILRWGRNWHPVKNLFNYRYRER